MYMEKLARHFREFQALNHKKGMPRGEQRGLNQISAIDTGESLPRQDGNYGFSRGALIAELQATTGFIVDGEAAACVSIAASPHTPLRATHYAAHQALKPVLESFPFERDQDPQFPAEYRFGKKKGKRMAVPPHWSVFWMKDKEQWEKKDFFEVAAETPSVRRQYWNVIGQAVQAGYAWTKNLFDNPSVRRKNGLPSKSVYPTSHLIQRSTPFFFYFGYADIFDQTVEWRTRSAQSNPYGHGNSPTIIEEYAPYQTVPADSFDIYKQVSPYDSLLFPVISRASLGNWYVDGERFQTIEHIDRGQSSSTNIPRVPFFEGIDFIPDRPVSISTAFELAATYAQQGEWANQIMTRYFELFHISDGENLDYHRERFREELSVVLWRHDPKKTKADGDMQAARVKQVVEAAEHMLLHDLQPTWQQLKNWSVGRLAWNQLQMDGPALDRIQSKMQRYEERAKDLDIRFWNEKMDELRQNWFQLPPEEASRREREYRDKIQNYLQTRRSLMKRYEIDTNGADSILAMKLDTYGYEHRKIKPLKPNFTLPVRFSGSVYFEFMFDDKGNMILGDDGQPLVQSITISPRFSEKGFFEDAYGAKVIRGRGA